MNAVTRDLVLIDTCIWVPFFNRPQSTEKAAVDELLDEDRAAINGPIVAEVLRGFRREEQADWVASRLRGVREVILGWNDWRESARLGRQLAAKGHHLPLSDLATAAVAIRLGASVYSTDPDFDLIEGLRRFRP